MHSLRKKRAPWRGSYWKLAIDFAIFVRFIAFYFYQGKLCCQDLLTPKQALIPPHYYRLPALAAKCLLSLPAGEGLCLYSVHIEDLLQRPIRGQTGSRSLMCRREWEDHDISPKPWTARYLPIPHSRPRISTLISQSIIITSLWRCCNASIEGAGLRLYMWLWNP